MIHTESISEHNFAPIWDGHITEFFASPGTYAAGDSIRLREANADGTPTGRTILVAVTEVAKFSASAVRVQFTVVSQGSA